MSGTWWTRFALVMAALLWSLWILTPTLVGDSATKIIAAQAERARIAAAGGDEAAVDAAVPDEAPWWAPLMSKSIINKGLDLQGGIDLTLQVDVDAAVQSTVQREIAPLIEAAANDGVALEEVRRARGLPVLLLRGKAGTGLDVIRGFMSNKYARYEYSDTRDLDGVEYHAFAITDDEADAIAKRSVEQALETLRSRIDETGVKEPSIVLKGGNRINVQLPGVDDIEGAIAAIGTTAVLEFMMVDEETMKEAATLERALLEAEQKLPPDDLNDDEVLSDWLVRNGKLPANTRLMWEYLEVAGKPPTRERPVVVKDNVILTGDDVNNATTSMNQFNEPYVALEFKPHGGKVFADVTGENVGRRFAIVLDRKVRSAPVIREKIGGGRASIEMGSGDYQQSMRDASTLSLVLRTGALPAPVTVGEVRQVGATLGADAIRQGELATTVGFGFVLAFMLVYYRKSGVVAVAALVLNVLMVLGMLAAVGATLTLPGITGIALTVGMAVDCNIIIFERIREELRLGKNARSATEAGFDKALWAVLDGNITTFIAGVVLYTYGTGPIKGFSVTLMIGILTTLFTGVFVTRTLMDLLTRKANVRLSI
jgi:preprotein translocase subunit SecD